MQHEGLGKAREGQEVKMDFHGGEEVKDRHERVERDL